MSGHSLPAASIIPSWRRSFQVFVPQGLANWPQTRPLTIGLLTSRCDNQHDLTNPWR
jgi:hypothetical protein